MPWRYIMIWCQCQYFPQKYCYDDCTRNIDKLTHNRSINRPASFFVSPPSSQDLELQHMKKTLFVVHIFFPNFPLHFVRKQKSTSECECSHFQFQQSLLTLSSSNKEKKNLSATQNLYNKHIRHVVNRQVIGGLYSVYI